MPERVPAAALPVFLYDLDEAAKLAAGQALEAARCGTFAVGAILLDDSGRLLHVMRNRVVEEGELADPTAHSERQLVDWYFSERAAGRALPPPAELTVLSSVDPCCMCAGALLAAGFRVVVVANDVTAGINYDLSATFPALPAALAVQARARFSYPAVEGGRGASGAPLPGFFRGRQIIAAATLASCATAFEASAQPVKALLNRAPAQGAPLDPRVLPGGHPLVQALRAACPDALAYTCARPHRPDAGLAPYLRAAVEADRRAGGEGDACALLDAFGNLVLCVPGARAGSPIATAYMRCAQTYAALRRRLIVAGVAQAGRYLAHPRHGTLLLVRGPDFGAASFMTLGAYGSTMEGAPLAGNPQPFQYVRAQLAPAALAQLCAALPPLYRNEVRVAPALVDDAALRAALA